MIINHLDLFSGIGGFSLAAQRVWGNDHNIVAFCESDKFCQKVLRKHWPDVPVIDDIREFDGKYNTETINLLTGGFPCQDISYAKTWTTQSKFKTAGIDGERSGLWFEMLRIIDQTKPEFVVAENVKALTRKGLDVVLQSLADIGYDAEWQICSAVIMGAPHRRERIFIVAYPIGNRRFKESIVFGKITGEKIRQASEWKSSRTVCQKTGKKTLPESFGIYDGIPRKLHDAERIKALGNAICPQVVMPIMLAIKELDAEDNL